MCEPWRHGAGPHTATNPSTRQQCARQSSWQQAISHAQVDFTVAKPCHQLLAEQALHNCNLSKLSLRNLTSVLSAVVAAA